MKPHFDNCFCVKFGRVPATAEGFDQLNARGQLLHLQIHGGALVAKKKSVAGTIMEPVILVPATLETQGSFPPRLMINPVCMKKVSSYNVRAF